MKILRPGDPADILAAKMELEKEDVFHVKNLYEHMHDWLEDQGWVDTYEGSGMPDKFEHYYWEKRHQNGMREHRIWWRLQKQPWNSEYYRYVLLINWRNVYSRKIEVVHKGQKFSTWRGDLTLLIEAWLQLDYRNMWRNHWLLKHLDPVYRQRIFKKKLDKFKKDLWYETYKFSGWVKQFLDMKNPFDQPEAFHPVGAGAGPVEQPKRRLQEEVKKRPPHKTEFWWGD